MRAQIARAIGLLVAVMVLALSARGVTPAWASNQTVNPAWSTTVSGPATATVGQTVTYTVTLTDAQAGAVGLTPPFQLLFPVGATNISVTSPVCPGTLTSTTSPATFTSCGPGTLLLPGVPVQYTVTLTLTAAAVPQYTLTYRDPDYPAVADATVTTTVTIVGGLNPTNTFTPAGYPHLTYSGQAYDPRCEFGCPPNGLP